MLCLPASLEAKRKPDDVTSPNIGAGSAPAVDAKKVEVLRGQTVEITLTGKTSSNGDMTFILRSKPKLGTLQPENPKPKSKISATLWYTASPDKKGATDEFTFAAQVPGSSTCEPAKVTIHIIDAAPKLDVPPEVIAKRVILGHPVTRPFSIRNTGNGAWNATVPAPKGWRWTAPRGGAFALAPGAEVNCEIECIAAKIEDLDEVVALHGDWKIHFTAHVVPPFSVASSQVALAWKGETKTRTGSIEITNNDARDITVQTLAPDWLKLPGLLTIVGEKQGTLDLAVEGAFPQSFTGTVKLTSGNYSQSVEVKAAPAPALLTIDAGPATAGGVHFGILTAETLSTAKHTITVSNDGGSEATLKVQVPEFFSLTTPAPPEGVQLQPGAKTTFVLLPPSDTAGTFQGNFVVTAAEARAVLFVTAGLDPAARPATVADTAGAIINQGTRPVSTTPRPRTEEERKTVALMNTNVAYISDGTEDAKLPRVSVVDIVADNGNTVTFGWDLPEGEGWKFQMYRATVERLKSNQMVLVWAKCGDEVKYTVEGRRATATVGELHPFSPFKFCLQTIAPDGKRSMPGKAISYRPYPPDASHWELTWQYYLAGAAGLLALGYWLRKKWKQPISATA